MGPAGQTARLRYSGREGGTNANPSHKLIESANSESKLRFAHLHSLLTTSAGVVHLHVLVRSRTRVAENGGVDGHVARLLVAAPAKDNLFQMSHRRPRQFHWEVLSETFTDPNCPSSSPALTDEESSSKLISLGYYAPSLPSAGSECLMLPPLCTAIEGE